MDIRGPEDNGFVVFITDERRGGSLESLFKSAQSLSSFSSGRSGNERILEGNLSALNTRAEDLGGDADDGRLPSPDDSARRTGAPYTDDPVGDDGDDDDP